MNSVTVAALRAQGYFDGTVPCGSRPSAGADGAVGFAGGGAGTGANEGRRYG